jgi:hypothetical protein
MGDVNRITYGVGGYQPDTPGRNISATDTTTVPEPIKDVIPVRDYFRGGDKLGGSDDLTYAVQAAINEAIEASDPVTIARRGRYAVELPSGVIGIGSPVRVQSVIDFAMFGAGYSLTRFHALASMEAMLDLNGTSYSNFENFAMSGAAAATVDRALWVRWNGVARSSSHNTFKSIRLRDLKYITGFQVGDPANAGAQADLTNWYDCKALGADQTHATLYQKGFRFGEGTFGNCIGHSTYGCMSTGNVTNVSVEATELGWWGGTVASGGVDFYVGNVSYFHASSLRSEHSGRLLVTGGPASYPQHITLTDITWNPVSLNADNEFVQVKAGGVCELKNVHVPYYSGKTPKVRGYGTAKHVIIIDGVSSSSTAALIATTDSPNGSVKVRTHVQIASDSSVATLTANS